MITIEITKTSRKKTSDLATSTRPRLGQAVRVVRIMPVPYSEAIVSTPSVITHIEPSSTPKKPRESTSWPLGISGSLETVEITRAVSRPMPSISTIMTPRVHIVDRTERSFVHSEARASPRWARRTGIGEV